MSQVIPVTTPLTPTLDGTLTTALTAVQTIVNPLIIPLTISQSAGLIKVGTVKSAEIAAIYSEIMVPYTDTIPSSTSVTAFAALMLEETNTENARAICFALGAILDDHSKIIRNNLMTLANAALDNGRHLAKNNTGLATAVKDITDTYLSRSSPVGSTEYSAAISGTVTINGVKTNKMCVNFGFSIISVLNVGGSSNNAIKIFPNDGAMIPKSWVNVVVTNLSTTNDANFSLFMM